MWNVLPRLLCSLSFQMVVWVEKAVAPLGGQASLEKVDHWGRSYTRHQLWVLCAQRRGFLLLPPRPPGHDGLHPFWNREPPETLPPLRCFSSGILSSQRERQQVQSSQKLLEKPVRETETGTSNLPVLSFCVKLVDCGCCNHLHMIFFFLVNRFFFF